ncbi:MAG: hypothetical protein ACK4YP_25280, partial [Myxococcota bacterium]
MIPLSMLTAFAALRVDGGLCLARGVRGGTPVLLRFPVARSPAEDVLRTLEDDFAVASRLDPAAVVLPPALERAEGRLVLVL